MNLRFFSRINLFTAIIALLVILSPFLSRLDADPIDYIFSGIGTGTLGASNFINAAFTLDVFSDTTTVAIVGSYGGRPIYANEASLALITIAGIGSGTITPGTRVFDNQGVSGLGFSLSSGHDLWDFNCVAAGSYDLAGSLAPVTATPPASGPYFGFVPTSLGLITFDFNPTVTFSAVIVPEPSTWVLASLGALVSLVAIRRKQIT